MVDEAHGHVFVTSGEPDAQLVVADLDGQVVQVLPDVVGGQGMLLTADSSTLYVALPQSQAIAAVDTATLQARTFATGSGVCPRRLAELGDDVYFTESCSEYLFHLWRLDPDTGAADPVAFPGEQEPWFDKAGPIASSPAYPRRLFLVDHSYPESSSATKAVLAYEIDNGGLTATRAAVNTGLPYGPHRIYGLTFSRDGQELLAPNWGEVSVLSPSDLSTVREVWSDQDAVSASAQHGYLATGVSSDTDQRIYVHTTAGVLVRTYFFDGPTWFGQDSVEFAAGRLYALAEHEGSARLYTFTDFTTPAPEIWVNASLPSVSRVGDPAHFGGTATLLDEPFAGHELRVWRHGTDGWVALPPVITAADGTFTIDDTPDRGNYRYAVLYPGEPGFAPERHIWYHTVNGLGAPVSLDKPPVFRSGDTIRISGSVTSAATGEPIAGGAVTVSQTYNGQTTTLPPVTTGPDGRFSFETPSEGLGEYRFLVSFEGDRTYNPSSNVVSAFVKEPASIEMAQPPQPYSVRGRWISFTGTLTTHDGQPVPFQRVYWEEYPDGWSHPADDGETETDAEGYFTFRDWSSDGNGFVRWRAFYKGDATNDVASTEVSLPVYVRYPTLEVRTDRSVHVYDTDATVEVLNGGSPGTVKLYAQPNGQAETLVAEGPATGDPDLVETLHATRNTTLTAVFEPTADQYWYAPNRVTVQLPVRPRIQQTLLGSYGKDRRTYLVRTRVDPRLSLEVDPTLPGRCVQVHVERYLNGAYTPVRDTSCIPLNQYSRARWRFTVNPPLGAKYRLRYEVPGDADYTAAPASWVNIRFTL